MAYLVYVYACCELRRDGSSAPFFMLFAVLAIVLLACVHRHECALVSQSSITACHHGDATEPMNEGGLPCDKKMLVSMTLKGGQVCSHILIAVHLICREKQNLIYQNH